MNEYLTFQKFITPILIQIIFWIGIAGMVIGSLIMIASGTAVGALAGLVYLVLGPIFWRVICEIYIVIFKIGDDVGAIRRRGETEGAFK